MSCGIYRIRNKINGKVYIGQSTDIESRWQTEKWHGSVGYYKLQALTRAMRKYGVDNFEFSIIEILPLDEELLNKREKYWIDYYDSYKNPEKGYNETLGGQSGHRGKKRSLETCQKISKALTGKPRLYMRGRPSGKTGKPSSLETRLKISKANRGKHSQKRGSMSEENKQHIKNGWTDEAKKAASECAKNQTKSTGWHHSDDAKKKMSKAKKGKPASNKGVPRTESQKLNDKIVKLKSHLAKGRSCIKYIPKDSNQTQYFVSEYEMAKSLTNGFAAVSVIRNMLINPSYIPKKTSIGWQILQGSTIQECTQSELLVHRPNLS